MELKSRIEEGYKKGYLENKEITYKVIPEKFDPNYTNLHPEHKGRFQFEQCSTWFKLPLSMKDRGLARILNPEEQEFFEDVLNMRRGDLSFYRLGSNTLDKDNFNFWYTFKVEMKGEEELSLNLNDPMDNLRDRVLKVQPEVSPDWESRTQRSNYKWSRYDPNIEVKIKSNVSSLRIKAYSELEKIKENKFRMLQILKSIGVNHSNNVDIEILLNDILTIIDRNENGNKTQLNVTDFLKAIVDKDSHTKALIIDAQARQLITNKKGKYFYNGDEIAKGMEELISWFNDSENADTRKFIKIKIDNDNNIV